MPSDRDVTSEQAYIVAALQAIDTWGYAFWNFPSEPDDLIARLLVLHEQDDEEGRAALRRALDINVYQQLMAFAQRMATLAVRERSAVPLTRGLKAIALAGSAAISDWRDTGMATVPLTDAAGRLGHASLSAFDDAIPLATPRTARLINGARPMLNPLGMIGRMIGRWFAPTNWKPVGRGALFRYGQSAGMPREQMEQQMRDRVAYYKRRMDERGYEYPRDVGDPPKLK